MSDWAERLAPLVPWLKDVVQLLIVGTALFYVLRLLVRTRAIQMLTGMVVLVAFYMVARLLDLDIILYVTDNLFRYAPIAALIVFQPELRAALSRLGRSRLLRFVPRFEATQVEDELMDAVDRLSRSKIGAILVMQRNVGLEEYAETGTHIQARVSSDLIASIFAPYGPLHDGAVLIEGETITAAGVILPLTQFPVSDRSLGTRHRAALGLTEETDAVVIVVSEETGQVSVAERGRLERDVEPARLRQRIAGVAVERMR